MEAEALTVLRRLLTDLEEHLLNEGQHYQRAEEDLRVLGAEEEEPYVGPFLGVWKDYQERAEDG